MKNSDILKRVAAISAAFVILALGAYFLLRPSSIPANVPQQSTQPPVTDAPITEAPVTDAPITEAPITQPPVTEPPVTEPEPVVDENATARLCFGGDTSLDTEFADAAERRGLDWPFGEVAELLSSADLSVINLETCVSERGTTEKKPGFGFRTPPAMLECIATAGVDMVNLANNHTRDFGYDALLDTFTNLTDYGIDYFGAGNDYNEATGLVVKELNGIKVGFVGCNYVWTPDSWAAAEGHAGINQVYDLDDERTLAFLAKVQEYDSQCDVLIAFMHCGREEVFRVSSIQEKLGRALIDNGADIVVGAHPHTLQPIEFYKEKPIFYSIGNLVFWHVDDDTDGLECIFDVTIDKNGFKSLQLHPVFCKGYKANLLNPEKGYYKDRYMQVIYLVNELLEPYGMGVDNQGNLVYEPQYYPPKEEVVVTE